jgi:probable HAF family extracellular repeat protein
LFLLSVVLRTASGQVQYTVTDLGTLSGGTVSYASGINNLGQVVGFSWTSSGSNGQHAFLYSGGTMQDLGTLGGNRSWAWGINDGGQVVGEADTSSGDQHAFLYSHGTMTDLGTLGGPLSGVYGINNLGQMTGFSSIRNAGATDAFLYSIQQRFHAGFE